MHDERASATAYLIALSLAFSAADARLGPLQLDAHAAALSARLVSACSGRGRRLLRALRRSVLLRALVRLLERLTLPGIQLHYVLRKRYLEASSGIVRAGLVSARPVTQTSGPGQALLLRRSASAGAQIVNDVHSQLNSTRVAEVFAPESVAELQALLRRTAAARLPVCVAGGRHAMGGQQFAAGALLLDTRRMRRVLRFEPERVLVEVEAGLQWPNLVAFTGAAQRGRVHQVGIVQKQTGADRLSLGGALAANAHERGLALRPIVGDVESFVLVDAEGRKHACSRTRNRELFALAIGGYGLFGVIASVTLRLAPRRKLQRVVALADTRELIKLFDERIAAGCLYGDFQFMTDASADGFLRAGILSCYRPVAQDTPVPTGQRELRPADWQELCYLAHADRRRAYELYAQHYLATSGQLYWSDTHQLSYYQDDYHRALDARLGARVRGTEMISELYVPRAALSTFMEAVRHDFRRHAVELFYGTIRLIERDDETFLAWARAPYACVVFNLHVAHTRAGLLKAQRDFRRLIARAVELGGSYYLTYHRWATRAQVVACYPQLPAFLRLKRRYDPHERFQSAWYRHYRSLFAAELGGTP